MFGEEKQSEELKAFEAALASLRPQTDGLDPRWRSLLAKEATLNEKLSTDETLAAGPFLCSRCGGALSGRRDKRRWAWPAAFSAMTAVAAALLVAVVVRVEPRSTAAVRETVLSAVAAPVAERAIEPSPSPAIADFASERPISTSDETAYLNVRDQVLRFGVESWNVPVSAVAASTKAAEPVLTRRGQLNALLMQQKGS
jgi:hypothetical protein